MIEFVMWFIILLPFIYTGVVYCGGRLFPYFSYKMFCGSTQDEHNTTMIDNVLGKYKEGLITVKYLNNALVFF